MKKRQLTIVLAILFFFVGMAYAAVTWHTTNQFTVQWDAVSTTADGGAITGTVEYEVFIANAVTDPNKANPVSVWRGPETQATLTLNTEGQYMIGVKAIGVVDGSDVSESTMAWSDDPAATNNATFGVKHFFAPASPGGLRPQ